MRGNNSTEYIRQHITYYSNNHNFQKKHFNTDQTDNPFEDIDLDFGEETQKNSTDKIPDLIISKNLWRSDFSLFNKAPSLKYNYVQICHTKSIFVGIYSSPIYIKQGVLRI